MLTPALSSNTLLTSDKHKIHFDHYRYGYKKVVVIAHGFFNSKDAVLLKELAEALKDRYDVILLDFRGHGKSAGFFCWTSKEHLDLEAVLLYAHKEYTNVGVIGFSLGAATSLITAARTEFIDSLIAVSAPVDFGQIEYYFWQLDIENDIIYNLFGNGKIGKGVRPGPLWLKKEKPIDVVDKIKAPVLYIHGEADWLIKPRHSRKLYDKTKSLKDIKIIKNGPHAEYLIRKNKEETLLAIRKWFESTL